MHTAAKTNRIFTEISSIQGFADPRTAQGRVGLLRDSLLSHLAQASLSQTTFRELTKIGIKLAENAYSFRDIEALQEASTFLLSLPLAESNEIGAYYYALALKRNGSIEQAKALFESVADKGPMSYRARAIQALGALSRDNSDLSSALSYQREALKIATSLGRAGVQTSLMAQISAATIQSDCGDHQGSLASLQSLAPLVQIVSSINPFYFYAYHNALAVELGEVGSLREAQSEISIALRSPFCAAYPELLETRDELDARLASAATSTVAVVPLPTPDRIVETEQREVIEQRALTGRAIKSQSKLSRNETRVRSRQFFGQSFKPVSSATVLSAPTDLSTFIPAPKNLILARLGECSQNRAPPALY